MEDRLEGGIGKRSDWREGWQLGGYGNTQVEDDEGSDQWQWEWEWAWRGGNNSEIFWKQHPEDLVTD